MIKRREFITILGGAAAWPRSAREASGCGGSASCRASQKTIPETQARTVAFRQALEALGWTEGRSGN